jgi:hypothetical protein
VHIYGKELIENLVFIPGQGFKGVPAALNKLPDDLDWFGGIPWTNEKTPHA